MDAQTEAAVKAFAAAIATANGHPDPAAYAEVVAAAYVPPAAAPAAAPAPAAA